VWQSAYHGDRPNSLLVSLPPFVEFRFFARGWEVLWGDFPIKSDQSGFGIESGHLYVAHSLALRVMGATVGIKGSTLLDLRQIWKFAIVTRDTNK
jgi:hypothetical protein